MDLDFDKTIDWAYNTAVLGDDGKAIEKFTKDYLTGAGKIEEKVDRFINWECAKIGAGSLVEDLAGVIILPEDTPNSVTFNLFLNVRLVAGIAFLGGHNVKDENIKKLVLATLIGNNSDEVFSKAGGNLNKTGKMIFEEVSSAAVRDINKLIGLRFVPNVGKNLVNLSKFIPIVSGLVSSGIDIYLTKKIAQIAKGVFIKEEQITSELFEIERNYVGICINLLLVDGKLESDEIGAIATLIDELLHDSEAREQMKLQLNTGNLLPIDFELMKSDKQLSENLINRLQELSMIDGQITTAELKYISEVINKINS